LNGYTLTTASLNIGDSIISVSIVGPIWETSQEMSINDKQSRDICLSHPMIHASGNQYHPKCLHLYNSFQPSELRIKVMPLNMKVN